jgi:ANTAR domain
VPSSDLADRAAALLSLAAATEERSLSQLTALAASQVAGCAAANVTVWRNGQLTSQAASHPDLSRLVAVQVAAGRGPLLDAVASEDQAAAGAGGAGGSGAARGPVVICTDTLTETRWPEFSAAALRMGVRCSVSLSYRGQAVVTLTLVGLRPRALDPDQLQLAELLVSYGGAIVGAVADYGDSRRVADQLQDAADSRAIVDQAKGILMHALGCSADEALERMREVSQRSNIRATEVARRVIDAHSGRSGRAARDSVTQLADLASRTRRPPADRQRNGRA